MRISGNCLKLRWVILCFLNWIAEFAIFDSLSRDELSGISKAEKGGLHREQSLTTQDGHGLIPSSWLIINFLSIISYDKHRKTAVFNCSITTTQ